MRTYLDLVNDFILETGINGGRTIGGVATGDNSRDALRIAAYVADADYQIQSLFNDWSFLWRQFTTTVAAHSNNVASPSLADDGFMFRRIDRESMVLAPGTINGFRPAFLNWKEFSQLWLTGEMSESAYPGNFTIAPNTLIQLSTKLPTSTTVRYEGWAKPYRMKSDGDVSPIVRAMASHPIGTSLQSPATAAHVVQGYSTSSANNVRDMTGRIIIVRAKIIYAEAEGAMEVMQGSLAEYEELIGQLQAQFLPGQDDDLSSETDDPKQVVTV